MWRSILKDVRRWVSTWFPRRPVASPAMEMMEGRPLLAAGIPRYDHVVIVVEENKDYRQIIGSANAPYINALAGKGALFTQSYGLTHPSYPNYLAMFSGSTWGVRDSTPRKGLKGPNLASLLRGAGLKFGGYAEEAVPRHNPWLAFSNVPRASKLTFAQFPADLRKLPAISIVAPTDANNMHDGTIRRGDAWLRKNLAKYASWAKTHNSLLIVTFDEDNYAGNNHIATVFYGASIKPGRYSQKITHYNLLRTLEDMFDLPYAGKSAAAKPVKGVWSTVPVA